MVGGDQRHCSMPCRAQDTAPQRAIQHQTPTSPSPRAAVRHTTIAIQAESCCAPSSPTCLLGPGPFPWRASNHRTPNWADLHFLNSFSQDHEGFSDLLWLSRPSSVVFDLQETWHFSCTDALIPAPQGAPAPLSTPSRPCPPHSLGQVAPTQVRRPGQVPQHVALVLGTGPDQVGAGELRVLIQG